VTPTGQFSNHLMVAFKRMYDLKAVVPVVLLQSVRGEKYKTYAG